MTDDQEKKSSIEYDHDHCNIHKQKRKDE
jgi:hypothetical protein